MCLSGLILVLVTVFCVPVSSSELVTAVEDGIYMGEISVKITLVYLKN